MRKSKKHLKVKMNRRSILIALFVLLLVSPVPIQRWSLSGDTLLHDSTVPFNWTLISPNPLNHFEFGSRQHCLENDRQSIKIVDCQNKTVIKWQSPENWKVTEAITADLNRDGRNELVMVVWREHKTWPIDSFLPSGGRIADFHDRNGKSCHLILVGWDGKKYRELWAGSSLIDPVFNIRAADLDRDGNQELVTLEGKYDNRNITGNLTVWDWSGFGFRLRDRQQGKFSEFGIVSANQNVMIVSD